MDWRYKALCRNYDPELFFPVGHGPQANLQAEEAKQVCRRCPVIKECLAWVLETGQDAGIWGGKTEEERREIKRRPKRAQVTG